MLSDHVTYHIGVSLDKFGSKAKEKLETENQRIHIILEQLLILSINDKKYEDYIEEETYIVKTQDKKRLIIGISILALKRSIYKLNRVFLMR